MRNAVKLAAAATVLVSALPLVAVAQEDARGVPVLNRGRPDYDAAGVRAGGFMVMPSLKLAGQYDDNIFASENEVDDYILVASPSLRVRSNWNNHALNFQAGADVGRYQDNDQEDYEDYLVGLDGRIDIARGTTARADGSYARKHEERGSPNDAGGREPTEYDLVTLGAGFDRSLARLGFRLGGDYQSFNFDDVAGVGSQIIDQDNRDREEYGVTARVSYETTPNARGFVQAAYNWRRYDTNPVRDSDGYRLTAGVELDLGGITTGELFAGYRSQSYDDPLFDDASGFTYGANLTWNATALTTLIFTVSNTTEETTQAGSSSYIASLYRVQVDHELMRNVILSGFASYIDNDYKGITRQEDVIGLGASAKYLINRNFSAELGYRMTDRDVNVAGSDYTRNIFFLNLTAAL
ncbi:outer membrane beta-barrel protein [Rhodospirillum centenum]|uniref:Outer membrane beta-barrel protein n=1 Tax=Rhodospirillum centenum (strain ATCC 51521 / SW) TaxID=414684 RepID=B6IYH0_RHOCS|nr:outer membrane beta-barrel protein [Rhodospirillum centenum]ACJ01344.1 conserved hypothetical protein [Rhodospirillum centenum SW]